MHAVGRRRERDVAAPVHEQPSRRGEAAARRDDELEQRPVVEPALSHLETVDAGVRERGAPLAPVALREAAAVTDGEQPREGGHSERGGGG
ncbi:hypothetical protein D3C83_83080 [compost metagenome]